MRDPTRTSLDYISAARGGVLRLAFVRHDPAEVLDCAAAILKRLDAAETTLMGIVDEPGPMRLARICFARREGRCDEHHAAGQHLDRR